MTPTRAGSSSARVKNGGRELQADSATSAAILPRRHDVAIVQHTHKPQPALLSGAAAGARPSECLPPPSGEVGAPRRAMCGRGGQLLDAARLAAIQRARGVPKLFSTWFYDSNLQYAALRVELYPTRAPLGLHKSKRNKSRIPRPRYLVDRPLMACFGTRIPSLRRRGRQRRGWR